MKSWATTGKVPPLLHKTEQKKSVNWICSDIYYNSFWQVPHRNKPIINLCNFLLDCPEGGQIAKSYLSYRLRIGFGSGALPEYDPGMSQLHCTKKKSGSLTEGCLIPLLDFHRALILKGRFSIRNVEGVCNIWASQFLMWNDFWVFKLSLMYIFFILMYTSSVLSNRTKTTPIHQ